MNKIASVFRLVSLVSAAVVVAVLAGCETSDEWDTSLTVSPSAVTSQTYPETVTFTVSGLSTPPTTNATSELMNAELGTLSMPLTWAVSNPLLGGITTSSGNQAVYTRTRRTGINTITVQDQYGAQGIATVTQESLSTTPSTGTLNLAASLPTIPNGENQSVITVISSGTSPYIWSVEPPSSGTSANGSIVTLPANSGTETYQSVNAGANLIRVTDAENRVGTITITQQ